MLPSGWDQAALCNVAMDAAMKAQQVSDELHIGLVSMRVKSFWPDATGWSIEYHSYDDMEGGDWYLLHVVSHGEPYDTDDWSKHNAVDDDNPDHEQWKEEIDNILASLWEDADYTGTIRSYAFDS